MDDLNKSQFSDKMLLLLLYAALCQRNAPSVSPNLNLLAKLNITAYTSPAFYASFRNVLRQDRIEYSGTGWDRRVRHAERLHGNETVRTDSPLGVLHHKSAKETNPIRSDHNSTIAELVARGNVVIGKGFPQFLSIPSQRHARSRQNNMQTRSAEAMRSGSGRPTLSDASNIDASHIRLSDIL